MALHTKLQVELQVNCIWIVARPIVATKNTNSALFWPELSCLFFCLSICLFVCAVTQVAEFALALVVVVAAMPHRVAPLYDVDQRSLDCAPLAQRCHVGVYACAWAQFNVCFWHLRLLSCQLWSSHKTTAIMWSNCIYLLLLTLVWGSNLVLDM